MTATPWEPSEEEYEAYWDSVLTRTSVPCPSCGMPMDQDRVVCGDCWDES